MLCQRNLFEWPGSDIFTCEWGNMIVRCDRDTPHQKTRVQICNGNARKISVTDYVRPRETLLPSAPPSIVSTKHFLLWHITLDRWCNNSYKILLPHCPMPCYRNYTVIKLQGDKQNSRGHTQQQPKRMEEPPSCHFLKQERGGCCTIWCLHFWQTLTPALTLLSNCDQHSLHHFKQET